MIGLCVALGNLPIYGQEGVTPQERRVVSPEVIKHLGQTSGSVPDAAYHRHQVREITSLLNLKGLNAFERALLYQKLGASHYELGNLNAAIDSFEAALETGGLNNDEARQLHLNIAQLFIGDGQYARGAQRMEEVANHSGSLAPKYVEFLTQAWVQAENYSRALPWAERWFVLAKPKERRHFDLLWFLYETLDKSDEQLRLVQEAVTVWPNDISLWKRWAGILSKQGRENDAFSIWKLMQSHGVIVSEEDRLTLVRLHAQQNMPQEAARILATDIEVGRVEPTPEIHRMLADLWSEARDYDAAYAAYVKAADDGVEDDEFLVSWSQAAYRVRECDKIEAHLQGRAVLPDAWVFMGMCYYDAAEHLKTPLHGDCASNALGPKRIAYHQALSAFDKVSQNNPKNKLAKRWHAYIEQALEVTEKEAPDYCLVNELCFIKIRQAYDAQVFTNQFELDEDCQEHKLEYDLLYRRKSHR